MLHGPLADKIPYLMISIFKSVAAAIVLKPKSADRSFSAPLAAAVPAMRTSMALTGLPILNREQ